MIPDAEKHIVAIARHWETFQSAMQMFQGALGCGDKTAAETARMRASVALEDYFDNVQMLYAVTDVSKAG